MNNNMNYFMPNMMNDFSYLNGMQNVNDWNPNTNNYNPKNNLNFNKCNFNGNTNENDLYDVYNGYIRGNVFKSLYNQYKINKPFDISPLNKQAKLLTEISAYGFAAHDLNLYLDTHPNDKAMFNLFKDYSNECERLTKEYEKTYGPLLVSGTRNAWDWNNNPWPWEN